MRIHGIVPKYPENDSHINYRYIMGDQRMMSFGFSGSPPPFFGK